MRIKREVTKIVTKVYRHDGQYTLGVKCRADGVESMAVLRAPTRAELKAVDVGFIWYTAT